MCFTAQDSLLAYVIGTIMSVLLIQSSGSDYTVLGYFFLFVTQMQLFDFLFWITPSCTLVNTIVTKLAILVNHLQPIVLLGAQYLCGLQLSLPSLIIGLIYTVPTSIYTLRAFIDVGCTRPNKNVMIWDWNAQSGNKLVYGTFLASLVASSFNFNAPWIRWLTAVTSVFSFVVAHKTPILNVSPGRIWCYYAALIPGLYLLLRQL